MQLGTYNTTTGVWAANVFGFTLIGGAVQVWAQVDKTIPLVSLLAAFTCAITSQFDETDRLDILTLQSPVVADFSTANPPSTSVISSSIPEAALAIAAPYVATLGLSNSRGEATMLHAQMRSRSRIHAGGQHRFAVGFAFAGVGGTVAALPPVLDYSEEFTGWGGERAPAGTDKAVQCLRCGHVCRESSLVADGVTRMRVCPECYDPPTEAPNFRWPFRS